MPVSRPRTSAPARPANPRQRPRGDGAAGYIGQHLRPRAAAAHAAGNHDRLSRGGAARHGEGVQQRRHRVGGADQAGAHDIIASVPVAQPNDGGGGTLAQPCGLKKGLPAKTTSSSPAPSPSATRAPRAAICDGRSRDGPGRPSSRSATAPVAPAFASRVVSSPATCSLRSSGEQCVRVERQLAGARELDDRSRRARHHHRSGAGVVPGGRQRRHVRIAAAEIHGVPASQPGWPTASASSGPTAHQAAGAAAPCCQCRARTAGRPPRCEPRR